MDSPQEYICTGLEHFSPRLNVFASFQKTSLSVDITEDHVFLGYKPLVIGIPVKKDSSCHEAFISSKEICLSFNTVGVFKQSSVKYGFPVDKKSLARLTLKRIASREYGDTSSFIYEGVKGEHNFLSSFHQFTNQLRDKLKKKKDGNVGLPGNLYEQVRIAYALPRIISIITVAKDGLCNMFPTDLHGSINNEFYVGSLRHEGNACLQVEETKKIVISHVSINCFRDAYAMGKNHMQDLKPIETFKIHAAQSELFHYPLNKETLSYRELELVGSYDVGIHRLLFYKIMNSKILNSNSDTLSHIHQYYEAWRKKQGIKTDSVLR